MTQARMKKDAYQHAQGNEERRKSAAQMNKIIGREHAPDAKQGQYNRQRAELMGHEKQ
jgi:hypothetical protein